MEYLDGRLLVMNLAELPRERFGGGVLGHGSDEKSAATYFNALDTVRNALAIEFTPGVGHVTTHYHENKTVLQYLARGSISSRFWDSADTERSNVVGIDFVQGMMVRIDPGIVHSYTAHDGECLMIELVSADDDADFIELEPDAG